MNVGEKIASLKSGLTLNILIGVMVSIMLFLFYSDNRHDNQEIEILKAQLEQSESGKKQLVEFSEGREELKVTIEGNREKITSLENANIENNNSVIIFEFQMRCQMAKNNLLHTENCLDEGVYTNFPL